ncbi:hypothetical protein HJC23_005391 [Cyclotella cryptica]|uniref:Cytochrome c oxidase assembly protein COX16, mitochondrial n=1 Tax=Cyclotella cryptica TaxID=29204 RepID=A0ABD3P3J0_9STRA|eukprot:CCRYP_018097-RA/>CCRYP_018097-RA protein AED:0.21 eAED:0.21 QI:64/1/1/1/1/1/2/202/149
MSSTPPSAATAALKQYKFVRTTDKTKVGVGGSTVRSSLQPSNVHLFVKAGLPFLLFSVGASYVLKSAVEGKNLEREKAKGLVSKSERQARLEAEKDEMMEKLNKRIKSQEFDNTKRIERPEEILERRKREREERNRWYKRTWRWITRQQ